MTTRQIPDTEREYEILVAGPVGPVMVTSLPAFTTATVLTGTAPDTAAVRAGIDLLRAHGLTLTDVSIDPHQRTDPSANPPSPQADTHLPTPTQGS
ncbi:MAG: hypothetical protein WCG47_27405 [Dermatophilaceae bacterium]